MRAERDDLPAFRFQKAPHHHGRDLMELAFGAPDQREAVLMALPGNEGLKLRQRLHGRERGQVLLEDFGFALAP